MKTCRENSLLFMVLPRYRRQYAVGLGLGMLALLLGVTLGVAQAQQKTKPLPRIGGISIDFGTFDVLVKNKDKTRRWNADLTGKDGGDVILTSARYDLAAPKVRLEVEKVIQSAVATGGVKIAIREPEQERLITATCDKATYFAAIPTGKTSAGRPARIEMLGNARVVMRSPLTTEMGPLEWIDQRVTVEFVDEETIRISGGQGSLKGTPVEQEPPSNDTQEKGKKP
jgi:hypothetical protein